MNKPAGKIEPAKKQSGVINIHGRWRDIPGFPEYQASGNGSIRSLDRVVSDKNGRAMKLRGRLLVPATNRVSRYKTVVLGRRNTRYVHELVLLAFSGPRPADYTASHLNGDRSDNRAENLAWETRAENNHRQIEHGTRRRGSDSHSAKLSPSAVLTIRSLYRGERGDVPKLAQMLGVHVETIRDVVKCKTWSWL